MRKLKDTERLVDSPFDIYNENTLRDIQEDHDAFIERSGVFPETVEVVVVASWGDDRETFSWVGIREETESEKKRRLASERQARVKAGERRKAKEAAERAEYERLKKKFGDSE